MANKPPLSAIDTVRIELYGPPAESTVFWDSARWDQAAWGGAIGWQDVTPQSLNAQISWGTDDNMGALSVTAAGSWTIATYDPDRILDPANYNSPFATVLKPGGLVRIMYRDAQTEEVVRVGFIDEVEFNIMSKTGSIRASDGISLMVKAKAPAGLAHNPATPVTLRAFARYILAKANVSYIDVEPDPAPPDYDPAIGLAIDQEASAWQQITAAALDCLYAVWLDREGVLHFRYFGKPLYRGFIIGTGGTPLDDVTTKMSMEGVFNHAIARYYSFNEAFSDQKRQESIDIYGDLLIRRERPIPNSSEWVDQILQDRGGAAPQYLIGTIRPTTRDQLFTLLSLGVTDQFALKVSAHGTAINRRVTVLGGEAEANTESGWSARLTTYEPFAGWWNKDVDRLHQEKVVATLSVNTTYDRDAGSSGDGGVVAIQELQSNFDPQLNTPSVQKVRQIQVKFAPIDFTKMASIYDARLRWYMPKHEDASSDESASRIGHIDQIYVKQIVGDWDASSNGSTIGTVEDGKGWGDYSQGEWVEFNLFEIVNAWFHGTRDQGDGLLLKPYPFETDVQDAVLHGLFAGAESDTPPYIMVLYKHI